MTRGLHVGLRVLLLFAIAATVGSCSGGSPANPPAGTAAPASFINRVWRVASSSSGAETGVLYVFLSDGTLVISSPHGTPSVGKWKQDAGGLTMIEEGISYKVSVLTLSADEFRIMIDNPGNAVEISFVPADQPLGGSKVSVPR
jgi:hypothetical protein